ncbi:MAG: outer membrane lipoprotein chaperone LolA [Limnohabitans sp.]|nr:outer membrane lipoprotein chaperone LolA [Limnohabitans sp.]
MKSFSAIRACIRVACFAAASLGFCTLARADSLDSLAKFLSSTRSMRAEFTQTVTTPSKDSRPAKIKISNGSFSFIRPTVFRFDYAKPFLQNIVADGKHLWLYDADMNQVTQRNQSQALGSTPAYLIAAATDLATLEKEFVLQAEASAEGLQWIGADPRNQEGSLQKIRIGLRVQGEQVTLSQLDILDAFGTRSQIKFERIDTNPKYLTLSQFSFVPPKGADLIKH